MTEQEKKAIEWLKKADWFLARLYSPTILNLIEKQSKEIEELKVINQMQKYRIEVIDERELISKDKIREKIKKYDEWIKEGGDYVESLEAQRYALQELLEE